MLKITQKTKSTVKRHLNDYFITLLQINNRWSVSITSIYM